MIPLSIFVIKKTRNIVSRYSNDTRSIEDRFQTSLVASKTGLRGLPPGPTQTGLYRELGSNYLLTLRDFKKCMVVRAIYLTMVCISQWCALGIK